jgi:hypothetical protein
MRSRLFHALSTLCFTMAILTAYGAVLPASAYAADDCTGGCGVGDINAKKPCPGGACLCNCSMNTQGNCTCN